MDPLERTFGREEAAIIAGKDAKYRIGSHVNVLIGLIERNGVFIPIKEAIVTDYLGKEHGVEHNRVIEHVYRLETSEGNFVNIAEENLELDPVRK